MKSQALKCIKLILLLLADSPIRVGAYRFNYLRVLISIKSNDFEISYVIFYLSALTGVITITPFLRDFETALTPVPPRVLLTFEAND